MAEPTETDEPKAEPVRLTWKDVNQATWEASQEIKFSKGVDVRGLRTQRAVFMLTGQTVGIGKIRRLRQPKIQNHVWAVLHNLYPDMYRNPDETESSQ